MKAFTPVITILLGLGVIIGGAAGLSVAASYSKAPPDSALYGLRTAGDAIRCAFSEDRQACFEQFAIEREQQTQELQNTEVGYSIGYPAEWQVGGYIQATEFANNAQCQSVVITDFQPPSESYGAAQMLRSLTQICVKLLTDDLSLDRFMQQTYSGTLLNQFQKTSLNGIPVYRAGSTVESTTIFLQTNKYRIQIVTSIVADPDKKAERVQQVQQILDSFSFTTTVKSVVFTLPNPTCEPDVDINGNPNPDLGRSPSGQWCLINMVGIPLETDPNTGEVKSVTAVSGYTYCSDPSGNGTCKKCAVAQFEQPVGAQGITCVLGKYTS